MANMVDDLRGELWLTHYDRAMLDALASDFLPMPNPDNHPMLRPPIHQASIPGVKGSGVDCKVVVIFGAPESIYTRYIIPGIWVKRTSISDSDSRRTPEAVGYKYRIPAPDAVIVGYRDGLPYYSHYVSRPQGDAVDITYTVEVRARDEPTALKLHHYVRKTLHSRFVLEVRDTRDVVSRFTVFRESDDDSSELNGVLDRYSGFLFTYKVQAEIDVYDEIDKPGVNHVTFNPGK